MADRPNIPEDDRDLKLAREIGKRLDEETQLSEIEDPLVSMLLEYRDDFLNRSEQHAIDSASLWNKIDRTIDTGRVKDKDPEKVYSLPAREHRRIWAAAAAILIIITAGVFYFLDTSQPTLIAETRQATQPVTLYDGSTVTLRPHSKIYLVDKSPGRAVYELSGEGFFEVRSDPNRAFSVRAGNGRVSVLGTTFVLSSWGDLVQVYLQKGSVQFETADRSATAVLEPGQYATIQGTELTQPRTAEPDLFTDWLFDELSFRNQPAQYVFSELEQHFNISIEAPNRIAETRIGGRLNLDSIEASLRGLGLVLGGSFEATGDRQYLFVTDN